MWKMQESNETTNYLKSSEIFDILLSIDGGFKSSKDSFFEELNNTIPPYKKLGVITLDDENEHHLKNSVTCNVFGCNLTFDTVFAFESHYNSLHRYLCSICKKNLPNAHLLDLHICENHDAFFTIQAERKPMYSCYLEECQHKSSNIEERKDHCIKNHKFPANFRFDQTSNKKSKGKIQCSKADSKTNLMDSTDMMPDKLNESLIKKKNNNYSFGHQKTKVFNSYAKAIGTKNQKTSEKMEISVFENENLLNDLKESLPY